MELLIREILSITKFQALESIKQMILNGKVFGKEDAQKDKAHRLSKTKTGKKTQYITEISVEE